MAMLGIRKLMAFKAPPPTRCLKLPNNNAYWFPQQTLIRPFISRQIKVSTLPSADPRLIVGKGMSASGENGSRRSAIQRIVAAAPRPGAAAPIRIVSCSMHRRLRISHQVILLSSMKSDM
jgi:hypothetical protein